MKEKLNYQRMKILVGMQKYLDRHIIGVKMYQTTYILYRFNGEYADIILSLNEIAAHRNPYFRVHDGNE